MLASPTPEELDEPGFHVLAGECEIRSVDGGNERRRGHVMVLIKPDRTVLVHDTEGYRPTAWITRAETISVDEEGGILTAVDGDHWLRLELDHVVCDHRLPGSRAGRPVGECPTCSGTLVDTQGRVRCLGCTERYGLPRGAELLDSVCQCGLPRMRVTRGASFELCIDRQCEPLVEAIAERFDGRWACPAVGCDGSLAIHYREGVMARCDRHPDCQSAFRIPDRPIEGACGCGLPRFGRGSESQCLDPHCSGR